MSFVGKLGFNWIVWRRKVLQPKFSRIWDNQMLFFCLSTSIENIALDTYLFQVLLKSKSVEMRNFS